MNEAEGGLSLRWLGGGEAHIVSLDKDAITLRSTVPSPPGSRLEGVVARAAAKELTLRIKVHSSRLSPDGDFVLEGRPIDLPRSVRNALARQLPRRAQGG